MFKPKRKYAFIRPVEPGRVERVCRPWGVVRIATVVACAIVTNIAIGRFWAITNERPSRVGWSGRADERRRYFARVIDADYRVVRRRQAPRFGWSIFIVAVAAIIVLRFAWPAFIMLFAIAGITSGVSGMVAVLVLLVILGVAAMRERWNGRPEYNNDAERAA
jgi:hypothetical protein